jgi:hypothetical protein
MRLFYLMLIVLLPLGAQAHPVIYQGGWALSSSNMETYSNNYLWYSVTNRFSIGAEHWRFGQGDQLQEAGYLKLNHLLWRKNAPEFQSNIYLHGGAGMGDRFTYQVGAEADWETRALFTSVKHFQFQTPGARNLHMTTARVGVSPIMADMGSLQTWFMVQAMHIRDYEERVQIMPLMRFFYHNVLWEVGSSTRGDWLVNLMFHY